MNVYGPSLLHSSLITPIVYSYLDLECMVCTVRTNTCSLIMSHLSSGGIRSGRLVRIGCGRFVSRHRPGILLRVEQHDVHLGHEEAAQSHRCAEDDAHAQAGDLDLKHAPPLKHPHTQGACRIFCLIALPRIIRVTSSSCAKKMTLPRMGPFRWKSKGRFSCHLAWQREIGLLSLRSDLRQKWWSKRKGWKVYLRTRRKY